MCCRELSGIQMLKNHLQQMVKKKQKHAHKKGISGMELGAIRIL